MKLYRVLLLFIAAALLLTATACGKTEVSGTPTDEEGADADEIGGEPVAGEVGDGKFTLLYESGYALNPYTGSSTLNMELTGLLYEGLFSLDSAFEAQPLLCDTYSTEDGITWSFVLKNGITMSDGSTLTADDAAYSINQARSSKRYSAGLTKIESCRAADGLTVEIVLTAANRSLPKLLDMPVIKYGSADQDIPAGTGPYKFVDAAKAYLMARSDYREEQPAAIINLSVLAETEIPEAFAAHEVDVVTCDPLISNLYLRNDHEIRYVNTTILEYIGFNCSYAGLSDARVRQAISRCVDRETLCSELKAVVQSPLILNTSLAEYPFEAEKNIYYSMLDAAKILTQVGMSDPDSDGWLEYPASDTQYVDVTIKFLVNGDSDYKVDTANKLASSLRNMGLNVTVSALPWEQYTQALAAGNFDMYYASAALTPDFDLSQLLTAGGSLNYGNVDNDNYKTLISTYLAADTAEAKSQAALLLCAYAASDTPIIPLFYRQNAVHTNRNVIAGITPTEASVFHDMCLWSISPADR